MEGLGAVLSAKTLCLVFHQRADDVREIEVHTDVSNPYARSTTVHHSNARIKSGPMRRLSMWLKPVLSHSGQPSSSNMMTSCTTGGDSGDISRMAPDVVPGAASVRVALSVEWEASVAVGGAAGVVIVVGVGAFGLGEFEDDAVAAAVFPVAVATLVSIAEDDAVALVDSTVLSVVSVAAAPSGPIALGVVVVTVVVPVVDREVPVVVAEELRPAGVPEDVIGVALPEASDFELCAARRPDLREGSVGTVLRDVRVFFDDFG